MGWPLPPPLRPLLYSSVIPEIRGCNGFPISGECLVCQNKAVMDMHPAKVYGKVARALFVVRNTLSDAWPQHGHMRCVAFDDEQLHGGVAG